MKNENNPASGFEGIFMKVAPWLIAVAAVVLIFTLFQVSKTGQSAQETSAYTRVSNCIVAKSANPEFTQDEIERCYVQVEKDTGVSLIRFDEQINNEN
jgi:hypothetical protein